MEKAPDVIVDQVVATIRAMDSTSLLDPKLVHCLVQAVLAGVDDREVLERRRRNDSRLDQDRPSNPGTEW